MRLHILVTLSSGLLLLADSALAMYVTPDVRSCLQVRSTPRGQVKKCVRNGAKLKVLATRGNWAKIGSNQWIYKPFTKTYSSSNVSSTTSFLRPQVRSSSCLKLRSRPSGRRLGCFNSSAKMQVLSKGSKWTKVKVAGRTGYVYTRYTKPYESTSGTQPHSPAVTPPPTIADSVTSTYNSDGKFTARWKKSHYTDILSQAIDRNGQDLLKRTPRDIKSWCPNYRNLNQRDKKQFWIYLISSLSHYESGHRTGVTYLEPGSLRGGCERGGRVRSRGLLQLSAKSAGAYYRAGCRTRSGGRLTCSTRKQLHDPRVNLGCGVAIMNQWVRRDGAIKGSGNKGAARYWSPFRRSSKRNTMKRWASRIAQCRPGYKSKPDITNMLTSIQGEQ